jgi:hypothetical protein
MYLMVIFAIIILTGVRILIKKEYEKPKIEVKVYASFENVFAKCDKTHSGGTGPNHNCHAITGWSPSTQTYSAFGSQAS